MLDESDALQTGILRAERSESLFAALGSQIQRDTVDAPVFVSNAQRDAIIFAKLVRANGNAALTDSDKEYVGSVIARDRRILSAMASGSIGRLPPEDQAHYASNFGVSIQNAGSTSSSAGGGYTVAPLFEAQLLIALKAFGGVRAAARNIQTTTGASLPWPTMDDTAQVATILGTENTTVGAGTDLSFGQTALGAYTYISGALPISLQLLQDSVFDFESLVEGALVNRFGRGQNAHFTNGTGAGQPTGVVTSAASGKVGAVGQTTSVIYADFLDLEHSVDPAYRKGAQWMLHDSTVKTLAKLVDGVGRPLWTAGLTEGAPDTFDGYEYVINQDMPIMAAGAKSVLFGHFSNYIVRDTLGLQMVVLRERYADQLQVAWNAFMRSDGRLVSGGYPIRYYQNSFT